jgi:hypothetical protein
VYLDFIRRSMAISGLQPEEVYERHWFALRNFHCQWYEDSDVLNRYLDHQHFGLEEALQQTADHTPWYQKVLPPLLPKMILKAALFRPAAFDAVDSTMRWVAEAPKRLTAFFKDHRSFESIPDWEPDFPQAPRWEDHLRLDHGYDEHKPLRELGSDDMVSAAHFRGGEVLSVSMKPGDLFTKLTWQCAFGHRFEMTPNSVLKGGHWCPVCTPPAWNIDEQARRSPFIAQVWYHQHDPSENYVYA